MQLTKTIYGKYKKKPDGSMSIATGFKNVERISIRGGDTVGLATVSKATPLLPSLPKENTPIQTEKQRFPVVRQTAKASGLPYLHFTKRKTSKRENISTK